VLAAGGGLTEMSNTQLQHRAAMVLTELLRDASRADAPTVVWQVSVGEVAGRTRSRATFDAWVPLLDETSVECRIHGRRCWELANWAADETVKVILTYDPEG
jgi:hypothetical protein